MSLSSDDQWLKLPDIVFSDIMMMVAQDSLTTLRRCTEVCSTWDAMITTHIFENQNKMSIIKDNILRALTIGPGMYPSKEDLSNAKWLSKLTLIFNFVLNPD